ncbi:unnamed protein product, partial [Anisakis simplex]|uniref:E74 like ETS transcription factor 1 n=1 Tax=Anisakis simplex TaxID=6269 RepID=A0A0M3JPE1_ANISI
MTCEGATSIGELEASKILATHASQEQQPAPEEGKTMQQLESAPSTTEPNVLTTPGEDTSANVSPPGQTQEVISGVTAEQVAIVSGVAGGESQKDESSA